MSIRITPSQFLRFSERAVPPLGLLTAALLAAGLYYALFGSPADFRQGDTVRIMYVHVPSAWIGMMAYCFLAAMSAASLIWKHPLADLSARASAPIGAAFTFLCLATGSLWGRPMWGTWWAWDARLTSMLILLFLYLGYLALANAFDDPARGGRAASILALAGAVNIPIIKFSVDWWRTLHQPSSLAKAGGPAIDSSMMVPLVLMVFAFTAFFATMLLMRLRGEILAAKIRAIRQVEGQRADLVSPAPDMQAS